MLLLKSFRTPPDRSMLHPAKGSHLRSLSLRARACHPNTRIDVRLLGPCFKTGRMRPLRQHPCRSAVLGPTWPHCAPGYNTPRRLPLSLRLCPAHETDAGLSAGNYRRHNDSLNPATKSAPMRFPFNNFTYCLTLFSKCFSSFDHSTCSLSVSGQYLALDGIYHPLGAAFPNNSTRRRGLTQSTTPAGYGTLTLCGILFQGTWTGSPSEAPSANYNSEAERPQISNLSCCRFTRRY